MRLTCKALFLTLAVQLMLSLPVLSIDSPIQELSPGLGLAVAAVAEKDNDETAGQGPFLGGTGPSWEVSEVKVPDPLEPMNRAFFKFNDRLYFWFMKPVSKVYATFIPTGVRVCIRNAFYNFMMPIRLVNNVLQAKFKNAGVEVGRFVINSTLGMGGFFNMAKTHFNIPTYDEDFGQTLGVWGMGPVIYIDWPLFGPSTVRDTVGLAGDSFLDPTTYVVPDAEVLIGVKAGEATNATSLKLGQYEDLIQSAIDPYVALRDAFIQHRQQQILR